jgi:hypothetical protein
VARVDFHRASTNPVLKPKTNLVLLGIYRENSWAFILTSTVDFMHNRTQINNDPSAVILFLSQHICVLCIDESVS